MGSRWGRRGLALAAGLVAAAGITLGGAGSASAVTIDQGDCGQVPGNLVIDCGFESAHAGDLVPAGWAVDQEYGDAYVNSIDPHSGDLFWFSGVVNGSQTLSQTLSTATPNTAYQVAWYDRDEDFNSPGTRSTLVTVSNAEIAGSVGTQTLYSSTTAEPATWTRRTATIITGPAGTPVPVLNFVLQNNPTYTGIDDVSVAPIDPSQLSPITSYHLLTVSTTVTDSTTGQPVPAVDTVNFTTGGTAYCTATTDASGVATCTVPRNQQATAIKALARARGLVTANYLGDPTHEAASTSNAIKN